jgi:hypothetical protein
MPTFTSRCSRRANSWQQYFNSPEVIPDDENGSQVLR